MYYFDAAFGDLTNNRHQEHFVAPVYDCPNIKEAAMENMGKFIT